MMKPKTTTVNETCGNCRFWRDSKLGKFKYGWCARWKDTSPRGFRCDKWEGK